MNTSRFLRPALGRSHITQSNPFHRTQCISMSYIQTLLFHIQIPPDWLRGLISHSTVEGTVRVL